LVWVAFVEQALERFLDASANVTFRLPKAIATTTSTNDAGFPTN
jgi:hypothetical protein